MIGVIIIILILVLGSLYALSKNRTGSTINDNGQAATSTQPESIDDIEADLQTSNFNDIESDFADIESELNVQ